VELERFNSFTEQLFGEASLGAFGEISAIHRLVNGVWLDANGATVTDMSKIENFNRTLQDNHHWRKPHDKQAYFAIEGFKAVVTFTCDTPSRIHTRNKIQAVLDTALKHSSDEFDANHDPLTGLLNSRSIDAILKRIAHPPASQKSADEPKILPACGLITLDLDYFKQVNDSYGHEYGDIVLRCFAQRLSKTISRLSRAYPNVRLYSGRVGGEEFVVIFDGIISAEVAANIAEEIRVSVSDAILPSEDEWHNIVAKENRPVLSLPHAAERKVTVSVGVSSLISSANRSEAGIVELRREADEALHRAKAGGRNTVRAFQDIRDKYGSVLEHHPATNIITIDIGSHLGVRVGNEFLVYHPDFTGQKPFMYSDGRTKKRLGTYPKLSFGRLIVIDVQPEIAFTKVAEHSLNSFPVGSTLEYIPLGSITHLISADRNLGETRGFALASLDTLQSLIDKANPDKLSVITFRLDNVPSLERAHGVVFINHALAQLFEAIQEVMGRTTTIGQILSDTLAVVARTQIDPIKTAMDVLMNAVARCNEVARFGAGIFSRLVETKPIDGDKSEFKVRRALDFARYAVLPAARESGASVENFTARTAEKVVRAQNDANKFREARADYAAFKDLGVVYWELENQLGLLELYEYKFETAVVAFKRASELNPTNTIARGNIAFSQFLAGDKLGAHAIFSDLRSKDVKLPPVYFAPEALAAFAQLENDPASITRESIETLLTTAKEKGSDISMYGVNDSDIDAAIAKLTIKVSKSDDVVT
jgi:diguanylate cyclase (GGDEF)-like protein